MKEYIKTIEFIELWNKCESVMEFMEQTGYSYKSATSRASRLRSDGMYLKRHTEGNFFERIGSKGGQASGTGGFASDVVGRDGLTGLQRASVAGSAGGRKSKRVSYKH